MSLMLDEIREQPAVLETALREELSTFRALCSRFEKERPRFIILAARGTSDNAAQFGRYLIEITTGIPVSLAAPSVHTIYDARINYKDSIAIGLSQSGESTDVNMVLEQAGKAGAITVGITNEPRSALTRIAEYVFLV